MASVALIYETLSDIEIARRDSSAQNLLPPVL